MTQTTQSDSDTRPWGETILELLAGPFVGALVSFALAIIAATVLITLAGFDVLEGYQSMLKGIFGSPVSMADVLSRMTPLIFTGLSVGIALRAGLFNVGTEGQLLLGAMAAALVGLIDGLPGWLHISLALLAAACVGGLWGMVPAVLKARFNAHEVITTIMLNYVVILFTGYLANYPFHPPTEMMPATAYVARSAELPRLVQGSQLTIGLFVGIGCALLLALLLRRSVLGYEIRAVGLNPAAAEAKGISQTRIWLLTMAIAGAMGGLGGSVEVLGVHRRFIDGFSPGYGFDGIAVALMGFSNPLGTIPAALVLGAIRVGALAMDRTTRIPADFVIVIQGLVLLFLSTPGLLRLILQKRRAAPAPERHLTPTTS
jgi:simple sugar transport system permease protein